MDRPEGLTDEERRGWEAYRHQRKAARKRGIPFLISFEDWWQWWRPEACGLATARSLSARLPDEPGQAGADR
jgi:hypothetical protein